MNGQVEPEADEKYGGDVANPFFDGLETRCECIGRDRTIGDEPCDEHNGQARAQSEDNGQEPVPRGRQGNGDIYHREEIDEPVGAKSDSKKDTEHERPQPTATAVGIGKPARESMVVLVVMMPREEQQHAADEHESRQQGFAPMLQKMLNTGRLRTHEERHSHKDVGDEFAKDEHEPVGEDLAFVGNLLVDIPDGCNAREERAGV